MIMSKADNSNTPIRSRRAVLAGIASAAALPIVPAVAGAAPVDPIFAAIAIYRQANAACVAVHGDIPDDLGDRRWESNEAVMRTRPTTPAGLAALTTWARERADWLRANWTEGGGDFCTVSATIDDAVRGMSGLQPWSPMAAPDLAPAKKRSAEDEALISLGAKLEPLVESYYAARAAWAPALFDANREIEREFGDDWRSEKRKAAQELAWDKAGIDEISDKMEAIVKKIKRLAKAIHTLPARSIEGLRAHALVAFWENAPTCADDMEYDFDDQVVHQRLFVAVADACGLSGHIASKGFVLPFPEFDEIDEEDEDKAVVEPA
jgi:hypothetical protein